MRWRRDVIRRCELRRGVKRWRSRVGSSERRLWGGGRVEGRRRRSRRWGGCRKAWQSRKFGDASATGGKAALGEQCVCVCVASDRGHHIRARRLRRERDRRNTVECLILCVKRAVSRRGLSIPANRCCLLQRCSCSSFECLRAFQLSAPELDFVVELLSGAVSRGTCRQVVRDRVKSRSLGT